VSGRYTIVESDTVSLKLFTQHRKNAESITEVAISKNIYVMINDMKTGFNQAARAYLKTLGRQEKVILVSSNDKDFTQVTQYIKDIGNPVVVKSSDYKVVSTRDGISSGFTYYTLTSWGQYRETEVDSAITYYYVPMLRTDFDGLSLQEVRRLLIYVKVLQGNGENVQLIGLSKRWLSTVADVKGFKKYTELVKDYPKITVFDDTVREFASEACNYNCGKIVHKDYKQLYQIYEAALKVEATNCKSLRRIPGLTVLPSNPKDVKFVHKMKEKYPLLTTVVQGADRTQIIDSVTYYLNLEDKRKINEK